MPRIDLPPDAEAKLLRAVGHGTGETSTTPQRKSRAVSRIVNSHGNGRLGANRKLFWERGSRSTSAQLLDDGLCGSCPKANAGSHASVFFGQRNVKFSRSLLLGDCHRCPPSPFVDSVKSVVFGLATLDVRCAPNSRRLWGSVLFHAGADLLIILPVFSSLGAA